MDFQAAASLPSMLARRAAAAAALRLVRSGQQCFSAASWTVAPAGEALGASAAKASSLQCLRSFAAAAEPAPAPAVGRDVGTVKTVRFVGAWPEVSCFSGLGELTELPPPGRSLVPS